MLFTLLPLFNLMVAVGGILLLVVSSILAYDVLFKQGQLFGQWLRPYLWYLITGTTLVGVAISLVYSELFLFVPCSLCWLQRIALYPQALITIIAWRHHDIQHFPLYGIALSVFGFLVAIYQYIYQLIPAEVRDSVAPCLMDGSADCGNPVISYFGFVTFPFVSAVTFAFLIILYAYLRHSVQTATVQTPDSQQ